VAGESDAVSVDSSVAAALFAAVPVDAVPVDAVPVDAVPVDAVPVDAAPVDATDGAKSLVVGRFSPLSASLSEIKANRCVEVRNEAPEG
jgi:hypothetical protein